MIADLKNRDEKNRLALTQEDIKYNAMMTQKFDDIARLQEENRSLRDQLNESEIKLAQSNDTISLLRNESDSVAAINTLRTSLTSLDEDKEKLLARADSLRSEIANCEDSAARVACELHTLSRENEALKADVESVKNTNDQLLREHENDAAKRPLKDALYTLPSRIYERIVRLRQEDDGEERDNKAEGSVRTTERRNNDIISGTDDSTKERSTKARGDEVYVPNKLVSSNLSSLSLSSSLFVFFLLACQRALAPRLMFAIFSPVLSTAG